MHGSPPTFLNKLGEAAVAPPGGSSMEFDPEADFDVRFAVARQNPHQIGKKTKFFVRNFRRIFFFGVEKSNVGNRLKRVLAKFRADPSQV